MNAWARVGMFVAGAALTMTTSDSPPPRAPADFWRDLFHLWFVKYNPLYLVSAMLVLVGLNCVSQGLAHEGSIYGPLAVGLLAEIYAASLIGGAALLTRMGQKRPAVLLALVAVVYQADLTLHTETCAVLGGIGLVLSALWLGLFVAKLVFLAWALRIRIGRRAGLAALVGAVGLAFIPYGFSRLGEAGSGNLVALFVFVLGAILPRSLSECVTSRVDLDSWGNTVLRRSVRATWAIWGVLLALHVLFWAMETPIDLARVIPAVVALAVARHRNEVRVWVFSLGGMSLVAFLRPTSLSAAALLVAMTLALRAFSHLRSLRAVSTPPDEDSPYRVNLDDDTVRRASSVAFEELYGRVSQAERLRLFTGTLLAAYVGVWTFGWKGGELPRHELLVDAFFLSVGLLMAWKLGARLVLGLDAAIVGHGLAVSGLLPRPHSLVHWGMVALVLGFVLLFGSVAVSSVGARNFARPAPPTD